MDIKHSQSFLDPFSHLTEPQEPRHQVGDRVSFVPKGKRKAGEGSGSGESASKPAGEAQRPTKLAKQKASKSRATLSFDPDDADG
jgi:hypothetical protein